MGFDEWSAHPYTKVLEESIAKDYVSRTDLVAAVAAEREACANLCESISGNEPSGHSGRFGALDCAEAIRMRPNGQS